MRIESVLKAVVEPALPRGHHVRRILFGPARGVRMEIDFNTQLRFWLGSFERELRPWFLRLCRPGCCAFDVGAREGYHTLALCKTCRGGRVLALEADPAEYERLRRNINANPSLRPRPETRLARVVGEPTAEHDVTLDEVCYGAGGFVPDLLKLDIEGWELKALQGAERLLAERSPSLIVETHSAEIEERCVELLKRCGYILTIVPPTRLLPESRSGHNRWLIGQGR